VVSVALSVAGCSHQLESAAVEQCFLHRRRTAGHCRRAPVPTAHRHLLDIIIVIIIIISFMRTNAA